MQLRIAAAPPSLNKLLRMHWTERRLTQKIWNERVWGAWHEGGNGVPPVLTKASIHIERRNPRLLDKDNAYGACKCVVDALKHAGIIKDDSPEHIELKVTQARGPAQTTITIEKRA